jgi:hypothetical protein
VPAPSVDPSVLSLVCQRVQLFEILFKWTQMEGTSEKTAGSSEDERRRLVMFGRVCHVALSYVVSLDPLFDNVRILTLVVVSMASSIAKQRRIISRYLLTKASALHLSLGLMLTAHS